jgi:hypothetical protein
MIIPRLLRLVRGVLLSNGAYASRRVPVDELEKFFDQFLPISTRCGLVRVGDKGEGGYLLPNDFEGVSACFSPGVSGEASFDLDIAERGIPCFLADYSVDGPPIAHPNFKFIKRYLGPENSTIYMTLESWVNFNQPLGSEFILQMDIEGAEYGVILSTPIHLLQKFRILVIEFHHLSEIFCPTGLQLIDLTFRKLLNDFEIVHIHPNNCLATVGYSHYQVPPVMEFTFLRKDRVRDARPAVSFPHQLDVKNAPYLPDIILPECWRHTGG